MECHDDFGFIEAEIWLGKGKGGLIFISTLLTFGFYIQKIDLF